MNAFPNGKWVLAWKLDKCKGGDMDKFAEALALANFDGVIGKIADGTVPMNEALAEKLVFYSRPKGVRVFGYVYSYPWSNNGPANAEKAGAAVMQLALSIGVEGLIIDAEGEWKRAGLGKQATAYIRGMRSVSATLPIGFSSYRYPELHLELPWREFLDGVDFVAPQVYWMQAHDPATQMMTCLYQYSKLTKLPMYPTGIAIAEHGWQPTMNELEVFSAYVRAAELHGISWWAWDDHGIEEHPTFLTVIAADDWTPKPVDPPTITMEQRVYALETLVTHLVTWAEKQGME
jgi:hypothetical protein